MNERLCHLLYALGISANYNGFHCICDAVEIAANNSQALTAVTKHIYLQIAKQRSTSWKAVERNIRSCVDIFWSAEPGKLQQLTGCSVHDKPTSAQFIAPLTHYLIDLLTIYVQRCGKSQNGLATPLLSFFVSHI